MGISVIDNHINGINFANEFCCAIFTVVILIALLIKKEHNQEIRAFVYFCFCSASAMWTDSICYMCGGNEKFVGVMYVMTIASYAFTVFAACCFYTYVMAYFEERKNVKYHPVLRVIAYIYSIVCSLIYASSAWTGRYFYIDKNSVYQATKHSDTIGRIILPLVIASIVVIVANKKLTIKRDTLIHLMYNVSYVILGYFDAVYTLSFHYIVMTLFVIIIFIFINMERDKELEIKQKELAISELNALRLQMNPHFVYNTLASIDGLVMVEPNEARQLIAKFTKHLRSSYLDVSPNTVPFENELENIKCYLSVEQVRFPDINIEYDIKSKAFNVPPLTVQPVIENAIKHGICKKDDSVGTIKISTYDNDANFYIEIEDDESILLRALENAVSQSADIESVEKFTNGKSAIEYAKENPIDIAFLDIEIHNMNGIDLAIEFKKIHPKLYVVFCTGYESYTLDAFKIHANGYLTKPIYAEDVQEQIDAIKSLIGYVDDKLVVKCFGNFDVFYKDKPLDFKRNKSKELFAYLIDKQGATVSVGQIAVDIWEEELDDKKIKNNLYQAYHGLKTALEDIGFADVLFKKNNGYAVNTKLIDCDFYKLLNKEITIEDLPQTQYMYQYSWAEATNARINR